MLRIIRLVYMGILFEGVFLLSVEKDRLEDILEDLETADTKTKDTAGAKKRRKEKEENLQKEKKEKKELLSIELLSVKKEEKDKEKKVTEEQTIDDIINLARKFESTRRNQISNFCKLEFYSENQIKQTELIEFYLENGKPKERIYPGKKPLDPRTSPTIDCLEFFRNEDNLFTITLIETYQKLVEKFNEYIYHPESIVINLVACGAIASYYPEIFNTYPYFDFYGAEAECGKSTFLECLTYSSFYGHLVISPSTSATFRVLNSFNCMMGIDELGKLLWKKDGKEYLSILLAGYRKGGVVSRCNENDFNDIKFFNVFGPKAWSRLEWIPNELLSRAITFTMMRNEGRKQLKDNLTFTDFEDIRNDLYNCRLFYQYDVNKTYNELMALKELYDRTKEIFLPILTIAKLVDTTIYYDILEYAKMIQKERKNTSMDSWLILLMEVLYFNEFTGEVQVVEIRNQFREFLISAGEINDDKDSIKKITSQSIINKLNRLGFKKSEKRIGNKVYVNISKKVFDQQAYVYLRHIEEIQQTKLQNKVKPDLSDHESTILSVSVKEKDTPTPQTNLPNLPNLPNLTEEPEEKGNLGNLGSLGNFVSEVGNSDESDESGNTPGNYPTTNDPPNNNFEDTSSLEKLMEIIRKLERDREYAEFYEIITRAKEQGLTKIFVETNLQKLVDDGILFNPLGLGKENYFKKVSENDRLQ